MSYFSQFSLEIKLIHSERKARRWSAIFLARRGFAGGQPLHRPIVA
jgi:hypothetical protein